MMRTTAAVRSFTDDPIPPEVLYRILDDARFAPSGGNQQGWHVTVVRDPAARREVGRLSSLPWDRYLSEQAAGYRAYSVIDPAPADIPLLPDLRPHAVIERIETVPEVLVVTVDLRVLAVTDRDLDRPSVVGGASIYPFVHNILLAARNQGLAGVLTTSLVAEEPAAADLLHLPRHHAIVAVIALGTPVHQPTRLTRKAVEEFTTIDRIDGPPLLPPG